MPMCSGMLGAHMTALGICAAIAVVVFGQLLYSVATFRRQRIAPLHVRHGITAELLWALIPIAIIIVTAWPAAKPLIQDCRAEAAANLPVLASEAAPGR
jgi:heme/copper-type cytochrome/quinol oxidase subunit 2